MQELKLKAQTKDAQKRVGAIGGVLKNTGLGATGKSDFESFLCHSVIVLTDTDTGRHRHFASFSNKFLFPFLLFFFFPFSFLPSFLFLWPWRLNTGPLKCEASSLSSF